MQSPTATATSSRWLRGLSLFVLATVVFSVAYTQAPLYYSNQNQYFLHGLAAAGDGHLAEDWLAQTTDPTPIFSALVAFTYKYLHPYLFYIYYALVMGVYFISLVGIFHVLAGDQATLPLRMTFAAVIVLVHSALLRFASVRIFGIDYPWYLQSGLAGQYILGDMFQPSVFGVLLIAAVYLFARNKPYLAATCLSLGAILHATYLLGAAALTLGMMVALLSERQFRKAVLVGAWALMLVLPIVLYNGYTFQPTSAEDFAKAQEILVHTRIPHHAIPRLWADEVALVQIGWIILGIFLARETKLYALLLVPFLIGTALTLVQIATDSDTLALLFPWRISAYLVPLATAIILSRLILLFRQAPESQGFRGKLLTAVDVVIMAIAFIAGLMIMHFHLGYQIGDEELAMMQFVRANSRSRDIYLLPVRVPDLENTVRGSQASTFIPLSRKRRASNVIPIDLQRFRLHAGAPIYVDFKSIPYKDTDVVEWRRRLHTNERLMREIATRPAKEWLPELRELGITHVVVSANQVLREPGIEGVYVDDYYRVYRIKNTD